MRGGPGPLKLPHCLFSDIPAAVAEGKFMKTTAWATKSSVAGQIQFKQLSTRPKSRAGGSLRRQLMGRQLFYVFIETTIQLARISRLGQN